MMGAHKLGFSKSEKYLGEQINQERTYASITETLDKREKDKRKEIMYLTEHVSLRGMNSEMVAIIQFGT